LQQRTPTTADVMAGRVKDDGFAYGSKPWESIEQIKQAAAECGSESVPIADVCV